MSSIVAVKINSALVLGNENELRVYRFNENKWQADATGNGSEHGENKSRVYRPIIYRTVMKIDHLSS